MKRIISMILPMVVVVLITACKEKSEVVGKEVKQGIKSVNGEVITVTENKTSTKNVGPGWEQRERISADTVTTPEGNGNERFILESKIQDVLRDPAFEGFGRLIFPVNLELEETLTLNDVGKHLIWYSHVNPDRTVSIVNEMKERVQAGEQIFYDIYTDKEKAEDPSKENTGLFYFRGNPGEKFAVINAGGGFMYMAAMHDSFPHMQKLAEQGYNAAAFWEENTGE